MIGPGSGGNTVTGNGNDILVGGTTVYDGNSGSNIAALDTILAEWASNAPYAKRISTIGKGVGFKRRVCAQLPHDPSGCERQLPLRRENSAPEIQLVPRQQTGQCYEETQRNQDHHLAATQAEMVPASAGDNRIGWSRQ